MTECVLARRSSPGARLHYAEMLAAQEEALGDDHPDTLVTRVHLAVEFLRDGEVAAAQAVLEETLRVSRPRASCREPTSDKA